MIPLIEQNLELLAALCRAHSVARLDVFGSAATGEFEPKRSDVDFIVQFQDGENLGPWLAKYFELKEGLEALLGRPVDLVMVGAPRNPRFLEEMERTRRNLFAA